ncbi:RsmD family RNA methyltransferase [Campylobacter lari]|uniref:16S rRNA (Guanine(966)-N(2))-methyltransferase RsmD n=1 Tax=Campylobacter lari TaxID=201 RepID=A0A5L8LN27_CAMLA|nr:RsmD family RNA methyltransferase [Campylobacter lari]EAK9939797.1 16S rRNA (guanine(966)-N(2))-methyltransferase RsmD [Campylobacter lari]EAL4711767.1 16S rRNA (guanine(966)-N(2))-methyltransferase RsmD [Campylobacter lari]MCR2074981.1 RsmD family RNA methyltransferase [Campylobacter lari subsp. concheus]MCR2082687.1 RsmD family RNA methyltransferase [Campylobacter lari subsp. concheus]MCR2084466.1 RsmD family RNA methyltransferase [Campylobacter lari subsp. concheus]
MHKIQEYQSVKDFLKNYKEDKKTNSKKQTQKIYTTIESGIYKGKKILLPSLDTTRSTKSIVKSCVFNVLRFSLQDKVFIEAFGGSALMALEARSNGCLKSYAIEKDKKAYEIALKNASNIDQNTICFNDDTFKKTSQIIQNSKEDIILYLDPPFDIREGFFDIYEKTLKLIENIKNSNVKIIIIEHHSTFKTPAKIQNYEKTKEKKFGSTTLSFYSFI